MEGLFVLAASTGLYASYGHSWLLFAAVLLAPDLFMAGYLVGPRVGAVLYNIGHTYAVPIGLGVGAYLSTLPLVGALALIWAAHIGMDRAGLRAQIDEWLSPYAPKRTIGDRSLGERLQL